MPGPVISNLDVYLAIATEALTRSQELDAEQTRPMPDGMPGQIITWDPTRSSFKHSLIAIVFAGVYLDALLYIANRNLQRASDARKVSKAGRQSRKGRGRYEVGLAKLGITDPELVEGCKRLNEARDGIVHERALEIGPPFVEEKMHVAQREAEHALTIVRRVADRLRRVR
jgi:hypothetical protein